MQYLRERRYNDDVVRSTPASVVHKPTNTTLLPRDATLARCMLRPSVRLTASLSSSMSVTSRCSVKIGEQHDANKAAQ